MSSQVQGRTQPATQPAAQPPARWAAIWEHRAAVAGILGLVLAGLLAPGQPLPLLVEVRWLAAYVLYVVLPGWLIVSLLLPSRPWARLETALVALAAGYGIAVLLGLVLHTMFQPAAPWNLALGGCLLVICLSTEAWIRRSPARHAATTAPSPSPTPGTGGTGVRHSSSIARGTRLLAGVWPALLVLAVAAPLRLWDLGWSEFQGDEARVVLRAMAALQGADGALAAHRKVPGEILLAYLFAGSLGQIVEGIARLPYALSAVGAVLAFFTLARGLLGWRAGLVAGLLLAVNGYFVAFGRILQYDSLSFFLGICGLLCCWRFGQVGALTEKPDAASESSAETATASSAAGATGSPVAWAFLGSLLIASAALVALGAIFLAPPALLLAWPGLKRYFWPAWPLWPARSWQVLAAWGWPIVPALLAAVLVLGASDPDAGPSGVWSYLGPRFGGDRPYWNATLLLQSANHYLSSPYLLTLLAAGAVALTLGVISSFRSLTSRGVVIRLVFAIPLAALTWSRPRAALAIGALFALGLALQAPGKLLGLGFGQNPGMRVALAWAAGPLFMHLLLVRVPGTHWREAFPGLILVLAALVAPALVRPASGAIVGSALALLILGSAHYSWVTLVQRVPEYQIAYPDDRHPLDWSDRTGRGIGGVFGAVHRHGWKALGVLSAQGVLDGGYTTNESPAIAAWYLRRPPGCEGSLAYIFKVDRAPQDRNLAVPVPLPPGYLTRGRIREDGRPTISIQMPPTTSVRLGDIAAEPYVSRFDQELASVWRPVGELYRADLGSAQAKRSCAERNQPS
ncbi:MAG: hypothetical protein AB7K36_01875 [Chloroflexota bacterium]